MLSMRLALSLPGVRRRFRRLMRWAWLLCLGL
nr:MAG TPA: hypothetical protein [Caudoviricetes sp.]